MHNDTVPIRTTPPGGQLRILEGFEEANVEKCTAIKQATIRIGLEYGMIANEVVSFYILWWLSDKVNNSCSKRSCDPISSVETCLGVRADFVTGTLNII